MSEWYARDISKKVKTGIKTKGANGKPVATEAPYGYIKDPENKDYWMVDKEAAEVVKLIFRLFMEGKNRNQIAVYLKATLRSNLTFICTVFSCGISFLSITFSKLSSNFSV